MARDEFALFGRGNRSPAAPKAPASASPREAGTSEPALPCDDAQTTRTPPREAPCRQAEEGEVSDAEGSDVIRQRRPGLAQLLALTTAGAFAADPALAEVVTLHVEEGASSLASTLQSDAKIRRDTQPMPVTGTIVAEVSFAEDATFGTVVTSFQILGGTLTFGEATYTSPGGWDGEVTVTSSVVTVGVRSPVVEASPSGPGQSEMYLDGLVFNYTSGTLRSEGTLLGIEIDRSVNLTVEQRAIEPHSGRATLTTLSAEGQPTRLVLNVALDMSQIAVVSPMQVALRTKGQLALAGRVQADLPGSPQWPLIPFLLALGAWVFLRGLGRSRR